MFFIAGVLAKDDETRFVATAVTSLLFREMFGNITDIRAEFAQKFPRPFGLWLSVARLNCCEGKLSSTILDIWQDEAQAFFSEGGADVDGFLLRMFNIRFSIKVPESENSENIKVDTIHGTKGLQFKHVFIFWNEEERESTFYLESEKCHVQFSGDEIKFLEASDSAIAKDIVANHEINNAAAPGEGECFLCRRNKGHPNIDRFSAEKKG